MAVKIKNGFVRGHAIFWLVLGFVVFSVLMGLQVYPTIQFPHFPVVEKNDSISHVEIYTTTGQHVALSQLIYPYDHRFYLFFSRALLDKQRSSKAQELLNRIWIRQGGKGQLYIQVSQVPSNTSGP